MHINYNSFIVYQLNGVSKTLLWCIQHTYIKIEKHALYINFDCSCAMYASNCPMHADSKIAVFYTALIIHSE